MYNTKDNPILTLELPNDGALNLGHLVYLILGLQNCPYAIDWPSGPSSKTLHKTSSSQAVHDDLCLQRHHLGG